MSETLRERVGRCEREIAALLAALEQDTGRKIESIAIGSIDITAFGDPCRQILRGMRISLREPENLAWET